MGTPSVPKPATPPTPPAPLAKPAAPAPKVATQQELQNALQALVDANVASYAAALANARTVLGLPTA